MGLGQYLGANVTHNLPTLLWQLLSCARIYERLIRSDAWRFIILVTSFVSVD